MKTNPFAWSTGPAWSGLTRGEWEELMDDLYKDKVLRSAIARDVRTPKYRPRVIPNKKRALNKRACRNPVR